MDEKFEDHCWRDVVPPHILKTYAKYVREIFVGPSPALLAVDLYEKVYMGGPKPIVEVTKEYPHSCGEFAWAAIEPTKQLFAAARRAGIPVFYTTNDARPDARPRDPAKARQSNASAIDSSQYVIKKDFEPQDGDVVITKQWASSFFSTPLMAHFTQLGIRTVIVCGESTSGCVRATTVDARSHGLHVVLAEECCFDRSELSHKVSLFDLHHKYADVMKVAEIIEHLDQLRRKPKNE